MLCSSESSIRPKGNRLLSVLLALSLAAVQPCSPAAAIPGVLKIRAEGFAPGQGARARLDAEADAKKQAILIWIDSVLGEISLEPFAPILERAGEYAQSSRIVELNHDGAGTHAVVEVYIREWPLRVDLAALLMPMLHAPPRVALLIVQEDPSHEGPRFGEGAKAVEVLAESLRMRGFHVEEASAIRERYTKRELLTYLRGGQSAIAKFGRENGVDVVIAGNILATVRLENQRAQTLRARATVALDVVGAEDGRLYESTSTEAEVSCRVAADGARMAMEDALYKARDATAVAAVLASASSSAVQPGFELRIENPHDWREVESVAAHLRGVAGVSGVDVLRAQAGSGIMRFQYDGKISRLVEALSMPLPNGQSIEPRRVIENKLLFRFRAP